MTVSLCPSTVHKLLSLSFSHSLAPGSKFSLDSFPASTPPPPQESESTKENRDPGRERVFGLSCVLVLRPSSPFRARWLPSKRCSAHLNTLSWAAAPRLQPLCYSALWCERPWCFTLYAAAVHGEVMRFVWPREMKSFQVFQSPNILFPSEQPSLPLSLPPSLPPSLSSVFSVYSPPPPLL